MNDRLAAALANYQIKASNNRRRPKRRIKLKRLERQMDSTAIDDLQNLTEKTGAEVMHGVYGIEDWVIGTFLRTRIEGDEKTVQIDGTWLTETSFSLKELAETIGCTYVFTAANSVLISTYCGTLLKILAGRGKLDAEILGEPKAAEEWFRMLGSMFRPAENLIEWVYDARGSEISIPLNYRAGIRAAYPWIDSSYGELSQYIDEYIDSQASVLILIGPPGTGKTTFIKNLIHRSKSNAKVAYDPRVMSQDGFFAGFIEGDSRFLVMEDADEFLQARSEGNSMMHKFLNVSDGLISAQDKKIVFSTNLPNTSDIDEALMRPGRCFDVLQFRTLTRVEAQAVLDEVQSTRTLPDKNSISLAEVFSSQPSGRGFVRRKIGFTS